MAITGSVFILVASIFAAVAAWVFWRGAQQALKYDLNRIPGPKQVPLLGNLGSVIGSSYVHRVLAQWAAQYGPIFKWNLAGKTVLVITDPDEVYKLCSREVNLDKARFMYKGVNPREPFNNILGTPDYDEWKYFRKMTNSGFSPDNIRKAYPKIYQAATKASAILREISNNGVVDVSNLAARITAEVINTAFFGIEMEALDYTHQPDGGLKLSDQPYLQHMKAYQDQITLAFTNPAYAVLLKLCPWMKKAKEGRISLAGVQKTEDALADMIIQRGKQPDDDTSLRACFSRIVNYKDGSPLPRETLAANVGIFFAAGYETTAHAITCALFELAADQSLQDRVRKELAREGLVPTPGHPPLRHLDFADLSKLKVLDSVIRETLRLHSTAPLGTVRETDQDMVIMGHRVPKGIPLMLSPLPMHLSPYNFSHPNKFWPDRWTTGAVAEWDPTRSAYPDATPAGNRRNLAASWNPFSTGPRNCIGQALALAELRTVLAVLLANFFFELPEGVQREKFIEEEEVWWVTLQTKHGVPLKVIPVTGERKKSEVVPKSDCYSQELLRLVEEAEKERAEAEAKKAKAEQ